MMKMEMKRIKETLKMEIVHSGEEINDNIFSNSMDNLDDCYMEHLAVHDRRVWI